MHGFTVGQRKGLGVDAPAPDGRPRYVLGIEPASGTVTVGPAAGLEVRTVRRDPAGVERRARTGRSVPVHGPGAGPWWAGGRTDRTGAGPAAGRAGRPLRGVAPGQTVAFYRPDPDGDEVLGSATIIATG